MLSIPEWDGHEKQQAHLGRNVWNVARLIELSRELDVIDIPLNHLNVFNVYENLTLREVVMHMKATLKADLKYPIILDEDGEIMDGRHRIMKAIFLGEESIKAVRFDKNPSPCSVEDK